MYACKSIENSIQTDKTTVLIIENLIPYVFAELNITPKNIKEFMPCI